MAKTATLNLRVDPQLKQNAENVLDKLGIPMATAIDMFLNQIVIKNGIPFSLTLPTAPDKLDITKMTDEELHAKLKKGYDDYQEGRTQNAAQAFQIFREKHS